MSTPREPDPAQLFVSVLSATWEPLWPKLKDQLTARLGAQDYQTPPLPFDNTSYYNSELGSPISRILLGFAPLTPHEELVAIKLFTNTLEKRYARPDGRRLFNIDPGFVTQERVLLATGKNFTHRVYLGRGIFADLTLIYQGNCWQVLPWTFPDYASPQMLEHLTKLRTLYREKLPAATAHREL